MRLGVDDPQTAFAQQGITLDALAEYQADKIPIVFLHGISDSPRCFSRILNAIDRERYQPWFLYYPSGISLSFVEKQLENLLLEAQQKFGFSQLAIVAHSMGGLIARACLNELKSNCGFEVPLFVTISTPWSGHDAARVGVKLFYPKMRPSWTEIASGGPFVEQLFSKPLSPTTRYVLFFSHRRKRRIPFVVSGLPVAGNHDGFVSLKSQLEPRAQREASQLIGYEEDHRSILASTELLNDLSLLFEKD